MTSPAANRIQSIDTLRGFAVILMIIHHTLFDLVTFCGAPSVWFTGLPADCIHLVCAGLFVTLAGVSSRFSRSNIKRGLVIFAIALVMSAVTSIIDLTIVFGVLHLLGLCMILYGLFHKPLDALPRIWAIVIFVVLAIVSHLAVEFVEIDSHALWIFGWTYPGFFSADYFPLFPWMFIFLIGTVLGTYIREKRFPKRFYEFNVPFLSFLGRKALIIYIVHQPVLYGIVMAAKALL